MIAVWLAESPAPCTADRFPVFAQRAISGAVGLVFPVNKQVEIHGQALGMQAVCNAAAFFGI
jgi:hypothetical protein